MNSRSIKRLSIIVVVLLAMFVAPMSGFAEQSPVEKSAMQRYAEAMNPGWNLGNTFDASGDETSWGNPVVTEAFIQSLVDQGFRSIRIPITWNHRLDSDYTIQPEFLNRIEEVINWSLDAGLYVMINLHHDTNWIIRMADHYDETMKKYRALWEQISAHFAQYPLELSFESINEPRFDEDWNRDTPQYFQMLEDLNLAFHEIVRGSGGNNGTRPLVLSTMTGSPAQPRLDELYKTIEKLQDDHIIATVHYYGFYPFSINLGVPRFDEQTRLDIVGTFDRVYQKFVAQGIPVIIGEFGLLGFDLSVDMIQRGEILKYFEYVSYYAKEKQLTLMLWDNGQHYDREAFTWKNPEIFEVLKAGWEGRSSNAESELLFVKRNTPIADIQVKMNLNGNSLADIRYGESILQEGKDYVLDGEMLTLKASFLESIVTDELGTNAVLTCMFSSGADWRFHIMQYETPVVKHAEGSVNAFVVPTQFNGDQLAAMQATYANGTNTAPNEWSPYQEFGKMFAPDYKLKVIRLDDEFLGGLNDGEVKLRFHFWSGTVLDYTLTKEGDRIFGTSLAPLEEEAAEDQQKVAAEEAEPVTPVQPIQTEPESDDRSSSNLLLILIQVVLVFVLFIIFSRSKFTNT